MARTEFTADVFERTAAELTESATILNALASSMRESGMPTALVHSSTVMSIHLPAVLEWVGKVNADVRSQQRAYLTGVQSSAELHKKKNENAKLAAAKKPVKKKTS